MELTPPRRQGAQLLQAAAHLPELVQMPVGFDIQHLMNYLVRHTCM